MKVPARTSVGLALLGILATIGAILVWMPGKTAGSTPGRVESTSQPSVATSTPGKSEESTNSLYEVIFRNLVRDNASGAQMRAKCFYFSINGKDPDAPFISRFKDLPVPVEVGSHFSVGKGLAFKIRDLHWNSDTEVVVTAGYYEANLSSAGYTITVRFESGKWIVMSKTMDWIS